MRTSISVVSLSALLLSASAVDALPSSRRPSHDVPDLSELSTNDSNTQTIHLQHRRGSEELMNDDGTLDFGRAHAHLARARTKYVRGLENFKLNTGEKHFLAPDFVNPSLLPTSSNSASSSSSSVFVEEPQINQRRSSHEEEISNENENDKRDKIFDASSVHGVPPSLPIANKRALEKRSVPKNPKIIVNPKHRASTTLSSKVLAVTSTPQKQTGSVPLTSYPDNSIWTGSLSIGTPAQAFAINFDTG
ncbi:hypothetical protein JCM5350_004467, partial [Sporobolomyces pararoseus]